ncbi:DUF4180 domain-containing protein [Burkholderia mayonis]|uniref:DUF4180 domain-containing protein n=1 Tax=Burkholderia mayonis TaxID=1385591 RepID=UPI001F2A4315|nr:DUF4180 domain-containing protein [Burkholderia mayonis]
MHDDFFRLDSCVAGHFVQKLINYGVKRAVVGDIDAPLARSRALRALVRETNRGDAFWLVADFDALAQRLCECGRRAYASSGHTLNRRAARSSKRQ